MKTIKLPVKEFNSITPEFIGVIAAILTVILLFLTIYYLINIGNRYIDKSLRIDINLGFVIKIFVAVVILYLIGVIFKKYPIVKDTFWALFAAIIVAFVMNPIVTFLENKGIKRSYGVIIVYLSALLIFTILLIIVIPKTIQEVSNLLKSAPAVIEMSGNWFLNITNKINNSFNYDLPYSLDGKKIIESIQNTINGSLEVIQGQLLDSLKSFASGMTMAFSKVIKFILVFIFSFYFLVDKEKFKNKIIRNLPSKNKDNIIYVSKRINQALLDFIKGRLLMAIFVGFATMVYLLILGVDFAIVIGLITCIADIIPYVGPFLGFIPAILFAFIESPFKALWVGILFVLLQWAENNIIAPKLLSDKTGLNPMLILISIIIGGGMFGVFGMILAVPVTSIIVILLDVIKIKYSRDNNKVV